MKTAPSYVSREYLIKKAVNRSKERIAEHIKVSNAYKPEESKVINENLDSIARYAHRQNVNFVFEPSGDELGKTKMEVFRRNHKRADMYDGSEPMLYTVKEYAGETILPDIKDKKAFMDTIRSEAAKILYSQK